jgi:hypothetical protein
MRTAWKAIPTLSRTCAHCCSGLSAAHDCLLQQRVCCELDFGNRRKAGRENGISVADEHSGVAKCAPATLDAKSCRVISSLPPYINWCRRPPQIETSREPGDFSIEAPPRMLAIDRATDRLPKTPSDLVDNAARDQALEARPATAYAESPRRDRRNISDRPRLGVHADMELSPGLTRPPANSSRSVRASAARPAKLTVPSNQLFGKS